MNTPKYPVLTKKKTFLCRHCGKSYGDCVHTANHCSLPQEESGRVISPTEFMVLLESGDI